MARIYKANVTFVMPDGDDRDYDTGIAVQVFKGDGSVIVWNNNVAPGQKFPDPGTYGPFGLSIVNPDATHTEFSAGTSQLIIHPNGNDRWITNVLIALFWDNGDGATCQSHTIIVDQDVNSASWSNSQIQLLRFVRPESRPELNGGEVS